MTDTPDEELTIDEFFGTEQTPSARMEVKLSYTQLHAGRPYYPEIRYADGPRMIEITDADGDTQTVIETETDLRERVMGTAINALEEWDRAAIAHLSKGKASTTNKETTS